MGFPLLLGDAGRLLCAGIDLQSTAVYLCQPMNEGLPTMTTTPALPMPTIAEIRELIVNRPRRITLEDVAKAADASVSWVSQLLNGQIEEPAYNKIAGIYQYLKQPG